MKAAIGVRTLKGGTGASAIVLNTASYLHHIGYEVDVYANKLNENLIKNYGLNPIKINTFGFGDYGKRKSFANKFEKVIKSKKYDIVIGHGDVFTQDILFLHNVVHLAHQLIPNESDKKIKTVGKIHDEIFKRGNFKHVVANSMMMKQEIISRYNIEENKIKVIYPGSDFSKFSVKQRKKQRDFLRQKYGISKDEILIGLITSGNFQKRGVEVFLKACNILSKECNI
jgi:UDP-glucose:(heptosyl)LPS alpha-1,3-glucosyltransferase